MAKNHSANSKLNRKDVLVSRLMCMLLYYFFFCLALLLFSNNIKRGFLDLAPYLTLAALVWVIVRTVVCLRSKKHLSAGKERVHSAGFVLYLALTLFLSLCALCLFAQNPYLAAVITGGIMCFLFFLKLAFVPSVLALFFHAGALFALGYLTDLDFFSQSILSGALLILALVLFAFALAALWHIPENFDGVIQFKNARRTRIVILEKDAPYAIFFILSAVFSVSLPLRVFLPRTMPYIAFVSPVFFFIYLLFNLRKGIKNR